jgi:hypothetical protein
MLLALLVAVLATPAVAQGAPALPATAKKLSGKEIATLYDGATVAFSNFTKDKPLTGKVTYDLKAKSQSGDFTYGSQTGTFKGSIRVKGDTFCYTDGPGKPEHCTSVYLDGATIYEVGPKGNVMSANRKI